MKRNYIEISNRIEEVIIYEEADRETFRDVYQNWVTLSKQLVELGAKRIPFPYEIAEGLFCLVMDTLKLSRNNVKFDCFRLTDQKRIEIKVMSSLPDFTIIKPEAQEEYDELYLMDFYVDGTWDGSFRIYQIDLELINRHIKYSHPRPRLSIYRDIIQRYNLAPKYYGHI